MHQHTEVTDVYLNELLKVNNKEDKTEQYWFPTPEQPGDPTTYTHIQKRIFDELQTLKKLNSQDDEKSRKHFWTILIGVTQHSLFSNDKKWKNCWLNFMIFLPDTGLTSEQIKNSMSNSHQMMIDQHIVKVFQLRST